MLNFTFKGVKRLIFMGFFAFAMIASGATESFAERTIYYNGKVFTADSDDLWAQGVVVHNRFIIAVGSNSHVLSYQTPHTTLVNLQGKVMIPGLNDSHVHPYTPVLFPRGFHVNQPDFIPGPGPTWAQMQTLVQQATATQPAGTWIFGTVGSQVLEDPNATRFGLDPVSPDHPVLFFAWYGHGIILNSKAMQVLGIGAQDPDPVGGIYRRMPNSNILSGLVHEYAEHQISRYFSTQMTDAELVTMYESFATLAAQRGYTSIQEYSVGIPQQRHLAVLDQANIPIKWRAMCFPLSVDESCEVDPKFSPYHPLSLMKASGIKWIADGTPFERFAAITEDYADKPGEQGHMNFSVAETVAQINRSKTGPAAKNQGMFHAVGDLTINTILDKMSAEASNAHWRQRRMRFEHGSILRPDKYASVRAKGMYVVHNPIHFTLGDLYATRYSPTIVQEMVPFGTLINEGIDVVIASDGVGTPGNPFVDIFFAVTDPFKPNEAVNMETAVTLYTKKAAEAEFQDNWKGVIKPGMLADLVVLSQDIFTITPPEVLTTQVLLTVVNGDAVYDAGMLQGQASIVK